MARYPLQPVGGTKAIGRYSPAISVTLGVGDRIIFVSGQVASDHNGTTMFPGDAYRQTQYVFEKIRNVLAVDGGDLSDLVSLTIYTTNIGLFDHISKARNEILTDPSPSSTFVEVSSLAIGDHLVEIAGIAVISDKNLT